MFITLIHNDQNNGKDLPYTSTNEWLNTLRYMNTYQELLVNNKKKEKTLLIYTPTSRNLQGIKWKKKKLMPKVYIPYNTII